MAAQGESMTFKEEDKKPGIYSEEILGKMYDILIEHAGARQDNYDRNSFVRCALNWDYRFTFEYRFMGRLGGGGKIWLPLHRNPYISCYSEDETPDRKGMMDETNKKLVALVKP
jgi:hypothetical protein